MSQIQKQQLIDVLSQLTVVQMSELVKELEELWGVSATPVMVHEPVGPEPDKPKVPTSFDVVVEGYSGSKIAVIRGVRELMSWDLRRSKKFIDELPQTLAQAVSREEGLKLEEAMRAVGAEVVLKGLE